MPLASAISTVDHYEGYEGSEMMTATAVLTLSAGALAVLSGLAQVGSL